MQQANADEHELQRFVDAQQDSYEQALAEIESGRKCSHWMWFIFPQIAGLGSSPTAQHYAIKSTAEAIAYLGHPVLGPRLMACADALLRLEGRSAAEIFGYPDAVKLRSSATLFAFVSAEASAFKTILDKYFDGRADNKTLALIGGGARGR